MKTPELKAITLKQLVKEVLRLAEEKPDYVYPRYNADEVNLSCYYQTKGKAQCIFGQAFTNLGITLPWEAEGTPIGTLLDADFISNDALSTLHRSMVRQWCRGVQFKQDEERSWSQAVDYANHNLGADNLAFFMRWVNAE